LSRKLTARQRETRLPIIEGFAAALRATPSRVIRKPHNSCNDLLAVYPEGDPHNGLYSWADEAGDDFDLKIARRNTLAAFDDLVALAPPAATALIICLGDLVHSDTKQNRTEASGHALDVDTRWSRVMQVTLEIKLHQIKRALQKHKRVIVRFVEGNHDPQAAYAIAMAVAEHFRGNRRVTIDLSPAAHWYFKFGRVLIGATHGDKSKPKDMGAIMATDRPKDWGDTDFRYVYHGHFHSKSKDKEHPGCVVEGFRTLAPKDAWHAGKGYRSGRDMQCIVHHKRYGERIRFTCPVQLVGAT